MTVDHIPVSTFVAKFSTHLIIHVVSYFCHRYKSLSFLSPDRKEVVMERVFDLLEKLEQDREAAKDKEAQSQQQQVKLEPGLATVTAKVSERE